MKKFFLLILSASLTLSCSMDDKVTNEPEGHDGVLKSGKSVNNMLEFASVADLENFITGYLENEKDLLEEAQNMAVGEDYQSLLFIYNTNLDELDDYGIRERDVAIVNSYDDMLHLLLNRDGELKIEDYIYRINGDFVYQFTEENRDLIADFLNDWNSGNVTIAPGDFIEYGDGLGVFMHESTEYIEFGTEAGRGVTINDSFSNCGSQTYRMVSNQFNNYFLFYSSIGSSTKVQKRVRYWLFGWRYRWKTEKRYNRLHYKLDYTESPIGMPAVVQSADGHVYCHCNSASKTYSWSVGVPAPLVFSPNSGTGETVHWAHEFSCNPDTVHRTIAY